MAYLALYNLIVYNLLQVNLHSVIIFHCWQLPALVPLSQLLSQNYIFSQYVDLQRSEQSLANFHKDYLDHELTKLGIFLDMTCPQSAFITNQSSRAAIYMHNFHWLLYDVTGNMNRLEHLFAKANLSINADITYIKPAEELINGSIFTLYDVYNKGSHLGGRLNITVDQSIYCNKSICERGQYLSDLHKRTRLQQRSDLSGITFRQVVVVTYIPLNLTEKELFDFLMSDEEPSLDWISRLGYRNNVHLQERLQFNVSNIWRDRWSVNDTIGGAMGELFNHHVELSTAPFVLSTARLPHVFPMTVVSQFRSVCMFRTPANAGIKAGVFLEPFEPSVWIVFGGFLLISGILFWLIFRLEHRWTQYYAQFIPSLLSSCLITFGAACIQGSHMIPGSTGGRLAFIAVMLTSFMMYNYYTSIVVSSLLGSPVRSDIKTVQQLADSSLDVGFESLPYNHVYLNSSPRIEIRNLVKRKVEGRKPSSIWFSVLDGILKVRDEPGFVFVSDTSSAYNLIDKNFLPNEICDLNEITFRPESDIYATVHRNSTYREILKQVQVRLQESGITQKHQNYYTKSKLYCYDNEYANVGMEYAAPLFIALLLSYFVAFFTLMVELIWARLGRWGVKRN